MIGSLITAAGCIRAVSRIGYLPESKGCTGSGIELDKNGMAEAENGIPLIRTLWFLLD